MISRRCLAIVYSALLLLSAGYSGEFELIETQKQTESIGLDWVWSHLVHEKLLFTVSHRDGDIHIFHRDPKSGTLSYKSTIDLDTSLGQTKHLNGWLAYNPENKVLYVSGSWTHANSDDHSLGLSWFTIDEKAGTAERKGHISAPAGAVYLGPEQTLHLIGEYNHAITLYTCKNDGTPNPKDLVKGDGIRWSYAVSPDNRFIYSTHLTHVSWAKLSKKGAVSFGGALELDSALPKADYKAVAVSPDGKFVYVALSKKYGEFALWWFMRDKKTGELKSIGRKEEPKFAGMNRLVIAPDGKHGIYCCGPETKGPGLGWLSFNRKTGEPTFGGQAPGAKPAFHFDCTPDLRFVYLGGFWSSKEFSVYSFK